MVTDDDMLVQLLKHRKAMGYFSTWELIRALQVNPFVFFHAIHTKVIAPDHKLSGRTMFFRMDRLESIKQALQNHTPPKFLS